jgi:hypothetical protein
MTDYVKQAGVYVSFPKDGKNWVILSDIEQRIKEKIEKIGKPLKDWNINIYRGILTGCNEAFIINKTKRDELIGKDVKSAEIIRPILRGRDIGRYKINFAELYLINTHNGIPGKGISPIDIKEYPAIKKHLDQYLKKLKSREDQGITPYNLRSCAYMDDFSKQKIVYPDIMRMPKSLDKLVYYPYFYFDKSKFYVEATSFILIGNNLETIFAYLVSDIGFYVFSRFYSGPQFDNTGFRYKKEYLRDLYIPIIDNNDILLLKSQFSENSFNITETENIIEKTFAKTANLDDNELKFIKNYKFMLLQR